MVTGLSLGFSIMKNTNVYFHNEWALLYNWFIVTIPLQYLYRMIKPQAMLSVQLSSETTKLCSVQCETHS